ncbi:MAG TPA: hypothetical protein VFC44_09285 [Candidatus Saccharimonadales bacterium]|nr:hypothetical protein [Candidatus Saccharimonadales bacterium]
MKFYRAFWWMITCSSICVLLATFGFRKLFTSDGVSVAWLLFSFSMVGFGVFGFFLTLVSFPIRERVVSVPARILLFGASAGLLWSLGGGLAEGSLMAGPTGLLVASGLSGVVVSFALSRPLMKRGRLSVFFLGVVSLPIGAFCFGVFESLICLAIPQGHPEAIVAWGDARFLPLTLGAEYAVFSVISAFAVFLIPLSILTTFVLRAVILFKAEGGLHDEATQDDSV